MNKFKFTLTILLLMGFQFSFSQTTEFQGTVTLGPRAHVYKLVTVPNIPQNYSPPDGATIPTIATYETKLTNGKTEVTVKDVVNLNGVPPYTINANKVFRILLSPNSD